MPSELIATAEADGDCAAVRIEARNGLVLICQGGPGSATEQIIEVSEKQVADLWRALIPVGEPR